MAGSSHPQAAAIAAISAVADSARAEAATPATRAAATSAPSPVRRTWATHATTFEHAPGTLPVDPYLAAIAATAAAQDLRMFRFVHARVTIPPPVAGQGRNSGNGRPPRQ